MKKAMVRDWLATKKTRVFEASDETGVVMTIRVRADDYDACRAARRVMGEFYVERSYHDADVPF